MPERLDLSVLGAKIKLARGTRTQAWLAGRIGATPSQVSEWERGAVEPRTSTLMKIAEATGVGLPLLLEYRIERAVKAGIHGQLVVREVPPDYDWLIEVVEKDPRLEPAIRQLIEVLNSPETERAEWLLGNIKVFAEQARLQAKKRRHRAAG